MEQSAPFCYRGYYYDTETGFYYLNSRYYDPEIGRFLNADRYADTATGIHSQNMFIYCLNNPVRYIDSSGEAIVIDDIIIIALVCVIAFSAASSVAVAGQSTLAMPAPKLPDPWDWPQQPERKVIPFPNSKLQVIPSPDNNKSEKNLPLFRRFQTQIRKTRIREREIIFSPIEFMEEKM
ncbi:MAG: RHS repeat-associated core domain-containing protein [Clostridiales bacterium]|nr:RHS repeat-associated core domain-containing protein [Clostridiales bacterium]